MRKIKLGIMVATLVCTVNLAVANDRYGPTPAFYVGLQGAYTKLSYNSSYLVDNITNVKSVGKVDDTGFGAHVYAGYQFNPYFAAELGYTYLPDVEFKDVKGSGTVTASNVKVQTSMVDLVAKGMFPTKGGIVPFGKAGLALAHTQKFKAKFSDGTHEKGHVSENRVVPAIGVGLSYQFNLNVSADITCTRYLKSRDVPNITLYTIGMAYTF